MAGLIGFKLPSILNILGNLAIFCHRMYIYNRTPR